MSHMWSVKDTFELIRRYKANTLLWDTKHWQYKDRKAREKVVNNIAMAMNVSLKEVARKLRNLRCQLRQEIKKLENMKRSKDKQPISDWCYFSAIKFLIPTESNAYRVKKLINKEDPEEKNTEKNRSLEQMENKYEETPTSLNNIYIEESKHSLIFLPKVLENESDTMDYNGIEFDRREERHEKKNKYVNISYDEEPGHSLRVMPKIPDEDDRFGEYVALELRSLHSDTNKRRLKSEIRRAICRIADFDDANILVPNAFDPLSQRSPSSSTCSKICEIVNVKSENA